METDKSYQSKSNIADIRQRLKFLQKPIVFVGMAGAGKTSLGRAVSRRLSLPFLDSDKAIEESANMTIADFFAQFGEPAFREGEAKVIKRLVFEDPLSVISLGGGAFSNLETREFLKSQSLTIWLNVPFEELWNRVKNKRDRPLLKVENPRETLYQLLQDRQGDYQQADLRIHNHHASKDDAVMDVLGQIKDYLMRLND